MYIIYNGISNKYLTREQKYYAHYWGYDDYDNYFICIRDDDNKNHILTKDYITII